MNEDQRWIEQTLNGQTEAFGNLVRKYQQRLYHALVCSLENEEDARDILQEAFLQAFNKLDTFRGESRFYTWLYRIAFNLAASWRRRHREASFSDQWSGSEQDGPWEEPSSEDQTSNSLERQEECQLVHQALRQLDVEHRTVLVLREMEDFSYQEIADVLHLPVGTVRSRLHRARLAMKQKLESLMGQDIRES